MNYPIRVTITGERGIGKSTIMDLLIDELKDRGVAFEILPSDNVNEFIRVAAPFEKRK